jgi:hypothetical protein
MRMKRPILFLLFLLFLIGPVAGFYAAPASSSFLPADSSKTWIIADVGQQNVIRLVASNTTLGYAGPVKNAPVAFSIDNSLLGTIAPAATTTDSNGELLCTFTVNPTQPRSGVARITANITSYEDTTGAEYYTLLTWDQNIDHNVPYTAVFSYSGTGAVEEIMPVTIAFFDRWDNKADDRYETAFSLPRHNVTLHVNGPSPPNDCGFTDYGRVHDTSMNFNPNGIVYANITPVTKPGWHYILMDPLGSIPEQMKLFTTVATGVPFAINQSFSPDGDPYATVLADGTSRFTFYYTLYDKYGNPTQNQAVRINISVLEGEGTGEESIRESIENGQIWSTYGPKSFTGLYRINATTLANTSLRLSKTVRFYNTTPVYIDLSANPQTLPSRDASPLIYSNISAKITDIMGNGVAGEVVFFTIHDLTKTPAGANETKAASFSSSSSLLATTAVTDGDGYAVARVYPSRYATTTEPGYQQQVTGTGIVTAVWNNQQRDVGLIWKNYPYLSAVVAVNPQQIKVGETVNVSLKLNGDGWALVPKPADVVLVTDLSGSMNDNNKLLNTKAALKNFVAMSNGKMFLGLASYANDPAQYSTEAMQLWRIQYANASAKPFNPYGSYWDRADSKPSYWYSDARIDRHLTTDSTALNTTIGNYGANGGTCIGCGLNAALSELKTKGYPGHNKTIVIMSDGIANMAPVNSTFPLKAYLPSDYDGTSSTIAKTAAINIASTIKDQDIKIYTIAFGSDADTTTLASIASPGCSYSASDGTTLATVYQTIYGKVFTDASVDTEATLDFGNLIVNNGPGITGEYFVYESNTTTPMPSTMLDKYNKTPGGAISYHLIPGSDVVTGLPFTSVGPITINQSDYWNDPAHPYQLAFNIGTIRVNETWQADFRLKVLREGNILIFGPQSQICFENGGAGPSCMILPNLSLSSSMNPQNIGISETAIILSIPTRTDSGAVTGTIPVSWTTSYNGEDIITEEVSYIHESDPPVRFDTKTLNKASGDLNSPQISTLNTEKLPPGGYKIQVYAHTKDASATAVSETYSFTTQGRAFIKLE